MSRKHSFIADRRGAVSFEMLFVFGLMMFGLLLPLADFAIAGFNFISARQALRNFGQYLQYNPPPDVTNPSGTWLTNMQQAENADSRFVIGDFNVICGDNNNSCSDPTALPKYYSYTTTVTLTPMVLSSVLCTRADAAPCKFILRYSERFQ
jgi:hypothetical protein